MNYRQFFERKADVVAKDLLGRVLMTNKGFTGQIVQTSAYEDDNDTPTRQGMLYVPGTIFLMRYRGSEMFNIATDGEGFPSCVEIRQLASPDGRITGSGKITKYLGLNGTDGMPLKDLVQILGEPVGSSRILREEGSAENCIGVYSIKK